MNEQELIDRLKAERNALAARVAVARVIVRGIIDNPRSPQWQQEGRKWLAEESMMEEKW